MITNKKRRFPSDRGKLHELLDKKRNDLLNLQDEVKDLEAAVIEADHTAIHETAEAYSITPERLSELLQAIHSNQSLPEWVKKLPSVNMQNEPKKEVANDLDDEDEALR